MKSKHPGFDANFLREILFYDPATGIFTWKKRMGRKIKIGDVAGSVKVCDDRLSYIEIGINYKRITAHLLAVFYVTGFWPDTMIDHADGDGVNNIYKNLRKATDAQNSANKRVSVRNVLGVKGVSRANGKGFEARIQKDKKKYQLGTFETVTEASAAYNAAALRLFGDFASLSEAPSARVAS